ncbi:ArsR/SmtB family transcription factor [Streptomyces monticola]|uniref:ArsR/SmtB family transcription factor n=1 Tax=Streptomyces monticola TaxID=2666263 RepID=A0ABW2JFJ7_9ACTN
MIRIHLSAADTARIRFASRPAPLQELNTAFMALFRHDDGLLFGHWRRRVLNSLPQEVEALGDLVPAARAPRFLDVFSDSLEDGLDTVRATPPALVREELTRVYAGHRTPAPPWIRDLHRGGPEAWLVLRRAQHTAFESVLRPVWPLVQDLHRAEFTRHALAVAEHGIGAALNGLIPGGQLADGVWQLPARYEGNGEGDIKPAGRGLLLLPTFHWTGHPLVADLPGRPVVVTYPAGPGLPLPRSGTADPHEALAEVLGATRLRILLLLTEPHSTSGLARRLGVSNATVSAHTAALRGAGLITTARVGKSVLHERTALGGLLAHGNHA